MRLLPCEHGIDGEQMVGVGRGRRAIDDHTAGATSGPAGW